MKSPIPQSWDVPSSFRERLGASGGRQRTMAEDGHVLVILHDVPNADDPAIRSARFFWRKADGSWRANDGGPPTIVPLREHVERFRARAEVLEDEVEGARSAADYFRVLHQVAPLLRSVRNMTRALQDARDATRNDRELIAVRDASQEVERALELIHGYAKDGLEFTVARNAEESAANTEHVIRSGHRLNLLAAVFLPITALGSLLGMNLVHGFETWHAPWTFWGVSAASFVLGFWIKSALPKPKVPARPPR